jgi:phosphoribosylformylglycinamidine synthase PurS subunit
MKIGVKILPRNEVLDTQGRAVEKTLKDNRYNVEHCRVGKFIELEISGANKEEVLVKAKEMVQFGLYNPLIENFELMVLDK